MDVGALGGILGSAAGAPRAQRSGPDREREAQEATNQSREAMAEKKAEAAADVGATEAEDQSAHERDADGRRLWEESSGRPQELADAEAPVEEDSQPLHAKDPSGETGKRIDFTA